MIVTETVTVAHARNGEMNSDSACFSLIAGRFYSAFGSFDPRIMYCTTFLKLADQRRGKGILLFADTTVALFVIHLSIWIATSFNEVVNCPRYL